MNERKKQIKKRMGELCAKGVTTEQETQEYLALEKELQAILDATPQEERERALEENLVMARMKELQQYSTGKSEAELRDQAMIEIAADSRVEEQSAAHQPMVTDPASVRRVFKCSQCGQLFEYMHQLGAHRRHEESVNRKLSYGRYQIGEMPANITKHYEDKKVTMQKGSPRIYAGFFIPKDWSYIRVHEPVPKDGGHWVFFQPLARR